VQPGPLPLVKPTPASRVTSYFPFPLVGSFPTRSPLLRGMKPSPSRFRALSSPPETTFSFQRDVLWGWSSVPPRCAEKPPFLKTLCSDRQTPFGPSVFHNVRPFISTDSFPSHPELSNRWRVIFSRCRHLRASPPNIVSFLGPLSALSLTGNCVCSRFYKFPTLPWNFPSVPLRIPRF